MKEKLSHFEKYERRQMKKEETQEIRRILKKAKRTRRKVVGVLRGRMPKPKLKYLIPRIKKTRMSPAPKNQKRKKTYLEHGDSFFY